MSLSLAKAERQIDGYPVEAVDHSKLWKKLLRGTFVGQPRFEICENYGGFAPRFGMWGALTVALQTFFEGRVFV